MSSIGRRFASLVVCGALAAVPALGGQKQRPRKAPEPADVFAVSTLAPKGIAPAELAAIERTVLAGINEHRKANNLPPLTASPELNAIARRYSKDMVERKFFAHLDPDGRQVRERTEAAGILEWLNVAENIARNRGFDDPARTAVYEWMNSEGHRQNILDGRYAETGIGVWVAPDKTVYFTQVFLKRRQKKLMTAAP